MSESKGLLSKYHFHAFFLVVVFGSVVYLIGRNIHVFGNILLAVVGFGVVVIVHEFGHFIVAKLSHIKVEAFSIFMPPTLLGVRRTEAGLRFRILPGFFPKENDDAGGGRLSFTVGRAGNAWDTEYRIGLIPFGGFVKMLGQEDVGTAEGSDDPRSYANKPVGTRMAVIAAGVLFNIISAVIAFMIVFLIGINLIPPVAGSVWPDSPAARAGLRPGDEIIEIAGRSDNLDLMDIKMAAALSGRDEAIKLRVKHGDGTEESFAIVAEELPGMRLKSFGIGGPMSLTIAGVSDVNALFEKTGLLPGDRIKAVNSREVRTHWELEEIVKKTFAKAATFLVERTDPVSKDVRLVELPIRLDLRSAGGYEGEPEPNLGDICYMVPRLKIADVSGRADVNDAGTFLRSGDIVLAIGDIENPTYEEMREVTTDYEGRELSVEVLRADASGTEKRITVTVVPERSEDDGRVLIGVGVVRDLEHAVVVGTVNDRDGNTVLDVPRGALITAVGGVPVSDFYEIAEEIGLNTGRRITIEYRLDDKVADNVVLDLGDRETFVPIVSTLAEFVPFEHLERLYKAKGPVDAIVMGYRKTIVFVAQAYLTLKRLFGGLVSPKEFMGPVGVVTLGYKILTEKPLIYYVYVLSLISAFIAVLNSVPILPFDGGHIAFLLVEKVKGSPVSERVQGVIAYAGWVFVGAFALYVTFNDIIRSFLWLSG